MVDFEVRRDGTLEDGVFDVAPLTDTANPFGDFVVVKIDDRGGQKFEQYERGTRLEVTINDDGTTYDRFTGYVVERREGEQQGSDTLEVEAYSFDQFLRRNTVSTDLTGKTIPEALESIVDNDSPVTYNSAKVEIVDDQELTRSFRGEPVEEVLRDLAFKSGNENFGVDDSLEFFFRPRESVHIDRGIDNTQWFRYDIPELGKEVVNEVEVWYNDGDESVIVDAPTDKLDLQDNLGLANPGTQRAELQRPQITDTQDAEDVGRRYLQFRNATLSGTVTTFGLYEAEPGDTINIEIKPRGIDTEFVIASVEYRWGVDETTLTIVEKRGDQDDILFELNDSVKRQELEGADRDAPSNRVTTTNATALFDVTVDADGNTPDAVKFVNPGRNAVRDAWSGQGNPDVSAITVGSDGSGLSRSNTDLANQTNSASTTQSLPDSTTARYEASITQTDVQEIGLETSGGTLIARATFDAPVDLSGTVQIDVSVSNDDSVSRGVLTNDGQTAVRDVLADNNPDLPTDYGYGTNDDPVSEDDTSLGSFGLGVTTVGLNNIPIQSAKFASEWESITNISETQPFVIDDNPAILRVAQTGWTVEGEDAGFQDAVISDSGFSNGNAGNAGSTIDDFTWEITPDYTIPEGALTIRHRGREQNSDSNPVVYDVTVDNETVASDVPIPAPGTDLEWREPFNLSNTPRLTGGETYQIKFEAQRELNNDADDNAVDVVFAGDNRFNYTFDNQVNADGYLDGPELYPDLATLSLNKITTRRDLLEVNIDSTWALFDGSNTYQNVSNEQFIEISSDDTNFDRTNNSATASTTFADPTNSVFINIGFSRFTDGTNETPLNGRLGQQISNEGLVFSGGSGPAPWQIFADINGVTTNDIGETISRAVLSANNDLTGDTIREAGLLSNDTLLTRHRLADFELQENQRLTSAEKTEFKNIN